MVKQATVVGGTGMLKTITDEQTAKDYDVMYNQYGISPNCVANVVAFAVDHSEDTNVSEFTVGPTNQSL
ncbi:hypothetical protein ACFO4N_04030 [Camelliibacillus cellulosilyticus]|uniref:Short subunit dehydrogenase n=1 Tax=Camelliibacillus cellulosilyticus TaxID=2174486 RepID=A0ABV9GM02_9BACL